MADELQLVPLQVLVLKHRKKVKELVNGLHGITVPRQVHLIEYFITNLLRG